MAGVVQMSALGSHGRWGNQLFQAAFSRAYAEAHDAQLQIPADWIGRKLFEGWEGVAPIEGQYPQTKCGEIPWGKTDVNLLGYFQNQKCVDLLSRRTLREWFRFKPEVLAAHPPVVPYDYCVWHERLEDYRAVKEFARVYTEVTLHSFARACLKYDVNMPLVTVSADWPRDEKGSDPALNDWFMQYRAKVLFRANSSFSWWIGVLSDAEVFAPIIGNGGPQFCEYVPGNWPRLVNLPGNTDLHLRD